MSSDTVPLKRSLVKPVLIVSCGNFLEMFDFMVFGYYAKAIGTNFFPASSELASLLLAFMTFGAGFLMRPVGAVVLGAYLDRHGRRKGLLLTLALMGLGTLSIALTPTYAQIGLAAPLIVLVGRLVQGLSAGVEVGGCSVYLAEIAPPRQRGFFVAWQSASQQVAVMCSALLGLLLNTLLPPAEVTAWGWRVPFVIGSLLLPFLFIIRRSLDETEAFRERGGKHLTLRQMWSVILGHSGLIAAGACSAVMTTVFFYTITAYTPTYGNSVLHLEPASAMLVTLCVGLSNFILLPVMGALSDRIGRVPLLLGAVAAAIVSGYPALAWLAAEPSFGRLLAVEIGLAIIYAAYNGALIVFLTEVMPVQVRIAGFSLAYSLATAIFGGFTPALATWLIARTGDAAMPGAWLSSAAVLSGCSVLALVLGGRRRAAALAVAAGLRA